MQNWLFTTAVFSVPLSYGCLCLLSIVFGFSQSDYPSGSAASRDEAAGGGCSEQRSDSVWLVKIRDLLMGCLASEWWKDMPSLL